MGPRAFHQAASVRLRTFYRVKNARSVLFCSVLRLSATMRFPQILMPLRFYNTLSQHVEEFLPAQANTVRMYTCGPTVYDYAHIGNFRTFTFFDILRRWLRLSGFGLQHVMNITDVDDKIIRNAAAQHKSLEEYTAIYPQAFLDDCQSLRLEPPERWTPATKHI